MIQDECSPYLEALGLLIIGGVVVALVFVVLWVAWLGVCVALDVRDARQERKRGRDSDR